MEKEFKLKEKLRKKFSIGSLKLNTNKNQLIVPQERLLENSPNLYSIFTKPHAPDSMPEPKTFFKTLQTNHSPCKCSKSHCLQLYCKCF